MADDQCGFTRRDTWFVWRFVFLFGEEENTPEQIHRNIKYMLVKINFLNSLIGLPLK
ncbi:MAG: hypothetical protein IPG79_05515 [Saprospiraceae bacterium]|nr:hypothetical protein [Saprospiraceae bacterium]